MTPAAARAFIEANTRPRAHPLVPEITLRLASEITPIWKESEDGLLSRGAEPPFWAFPWPGGIAVARYLLDQPEEAAGRYVFDVAAGSGIGAIAAAMAGARRAAAADIDPLARVAIGLNAALNGIKVAVPPGDPLARPAPAADTVLAGDVFYERPLAERILPWLRAVTHRGARVLIADPGRAYLPAHGLKPLARYDVATTRELEDREMRETVVYRLTA